MQVVVNVVGHGLPVGEAIDRPRVHVDEPHVHCEGGLDADELDALEAAGLRRRALAAAEPLLRRRGRGRAPRRREPRRRRRSAPRRPRRRRRSERLQRPARPRRATRRRSSRWHSAVGGRAGGMADRGRRRGAASPRSGATCKALRRHPHAAVFVAEAADAIVGRLSVARDPHPASFHVADLGLMVAAGHRRRGVGRALLEHAVEWAREARCPQARAARLPAQRAGDRALRDVRLRPRGLPPRPLPPRRTGTWTRS